MEFGKLHVVVLHFPIALIVAAAVADFLLLITRRPFFRNAGLYCLIGALVTGPLAAATGWDLLDDMKPAGDLARLTLADLLWWVNLAGAATPPAEAPPLATLAAWHRVFGIAAVALVVAVAVVRLIRAKSAAKWLAVVYAFLVLVTLAVVAAAAHLGGILAFGKDFFYGAS